MGFFHFSGIVVFRLYIFLTNIFNCSNYKSTFSHLEKSVPVSYDIPSFWKLGDSQKDFSLATLSETVKPYLFCQLKNILRFFLFQLITMRTDGQRRNCLKIASCGILQKAGTHRESCTQPSRNPSLAGTFCAFLWATAQNLPHLNKPQPLLTASTWCIRAEVCNTNIQEHGMVQVPSLYHYFLFGFLKNSFNNSTAFGVFFLCCHRLGLCSVNH